MVGGRGEPDPQVGRRRLGVDWCLRLSPHYCNTEEEVDHVADPVAGLARRGRR
ncbi:hypothetical protein [Streptomyces zhihengii]